MRKKVLSIIFAIILIFALKDISYAASANISCESETTVGKEITITANVTGVQWNLELKVNGQTIAKNSELENYESNKSVSFSGKYTPNTAGTLNISLEGTVTEYSDGSTIRNFGTKTITVKAPENNNSNSNSGNSSSSEPATKSTEARLKTFGIEPDDYDFSGFSRNPDKENWSTEVPNNVTKVKVYATAADKNARVDGAGELSLKEGDNDVKVTVTAEAGNTKTYTLTIKRRTAAEEEQASDKSDATLKNLGISPKEYDFSGFKKSQTEYSVEVPNKIKTVEIYAEATDSKAQVTGIGEIELNEGANEAKVEVIAQDGTKKTYTITITRKVSEVIAATNDDNEGSDNTENLTETEMPEISENQEEIETKKSGLGKETIIKLILALVLIVLIIIAVILKIKISKEAKEQEGLEKDDESIKFPGAKELDKAIAEHQELIDEDEEEPKKKRKGKHF